MACFPDAYEKIPDVIISYLANQLNLPVSSYSDYNWKGRSAKVYRAEIRNLFDFRIVTAQDSEEMSDWLITEIVPNEQKIESIREIVYKRFRELRIESPTADRIERLIRHALSVWETQLCHQIFTQLSATVKQEIDILLQTEDNEDELTRETKLKTSDFAFLKTDPGPVGLDSFLTEIDKLKRIRQIKLPANLFQGICPKVIQKYLQRAATESPYDIRQHPEPIRYTLMSAFCYKRSQEIIDNLIEILISIIKRIGTRAERRINTGINNENYHDLLYVRRRYIQKDQLRSAIADVINAIFEIRHPEIWGEGTTTCASDSKHFGSWEQNLMNQYHLRYGGRGVMIYWHVEKKSTCIYSQLKTVSSSEVSAMIEGVLRHCTEMEVKKNYVDSQ